MIFSVILMGFSGVKNAALLPSPSSKALPHRHKRRGRTSCWAEQQKQPHLLRGTKHCPLLQAPWDAAALVLTVSTSSIKRKWAWRCLSSSPCSLPQLAVLSFFFFFYLKISYIFQSRSFHPSSFKIAVGYLLLALLCGLYVPPCI